MSSETETCWGSRCCPALGPDHGCRVHSNSLHPSVNRGQLRREAEHEEGGMTNCHCVGFCRYKGFSLAGTMDRLSTELK